MEKLLEKNHKIIFAVIAFFLIYPTFQRGYIFLLDWMALPNAGITDINWSFDSIGIILYKLLSVMLGFGIIQRIVLFAIIFFAGTAGFRLAKKTRNIYARYFSGLFFIFNPFIYARIVEQPNIAGGAVLFLWFLVYFLEYMEEKNKQKLLLSSVFAAFSVSFSIHSIFFIGLAMAVVLFFDFMKSKDWKFCLKAFSVVFCFIIILNLNWMIYLVGGAEKGIGSIRNFSHEDIITFKTRDIGGISVCAAVLAMQGYWGENQDRFVSVQDNSLWFPAFLLIFSLSVFGLVKSWKTNSLTKPLAVLFGVAFVLAVGVASPVFKPLALFLYDEVPFYIGLRESQKWVVVLVFVYAYLGGWGIKYIMDMKRMKNYRGEIGIFCVILPVLFSFSAILGMHNHFTPHEFPSGWHEAKKYLVENPSDGKILFLPWHAYMKFDFAEKNIINPARSFFGKEIIQGNNTEFKEVYSHYFDEQTLTIEKYVLKKGDGEEKINRQNFLTDMEKIGVEKIILAKAEDWKNYLWIGEVNGAEKAMENNGIIIYELK